ncbi:MAG: hypothetical protein ABSF84_02705 [Acidimicrobiales bacterium]|jgi:hypothetical protein
MDTYLDPIDIALHWPFLRTQLLFERRPAYVRALDVLAGLQADSGGQPVRIGTRRWREAGLTGGEIGRSTTALRDLQELGVVHRDKGSGARAHSWTFQPTVRNWRSMPWVSSGRDAHRVIEGCIYRAACPGIARFPGQSVAGSRGNRHFRLSAEMHLHPPGLLPVETRDPVASRAIPWHGRAYEPVETRDPVAASRSLYLSPRELTFSIEGSEQRFAVLTKAIEARTGQPLYGYKPIARVKALAEKLDDGQAEALAREIAMSTGHQYIPNIIGIAEDLSVDRRVVMEARRQQEGSVRFSGPETDHLQDLSQLADRFAFQPEPAA